MTLSYLPSIAYVFMLIFARLGTMMMFMPALGEQNIPARIRLSMALALTFVMFPIVSDSYGPMPSSFAAILPVFVQEFAIGFGIGLAARLILSALQIAGTTIAFQFGLSYAQSFDPTAGTQGALLGAFLSVLGVALVFATDLHHLAIAGLYDSYILFKPGEPILAGDFAQVATNSVAAAFRIAVQISAPFIVFGFLFYLGLGILSRLMPQVQIFFVAMPANIAFGMILFAFLIVAIMTWYLNHLEAALGQFLVN